MTVIFDEEINNDVYDVSRSYNDEEFEDFDDYDEIVDEFNNEEEYELEEDEFEEDDEGNLIIKIKSQHPVYHVKTRKEEEADHARYIELENERYKDALQKLSILEGKLNWIDKCDECPTTGLSPHATVDFDQFPFITKVTSEKVRLQKRRSPREIGPILRRARKFVPATHIKIQIGEETCIILKRECKAYNAGKCRFGDKCKFLHNAKTAKVTRQKNKPECKYGSKCANKRCTFIHSSEPTNLEISTSSGYSSSSNNEVAPKILDTNDKEMKSCNYKVWLCKNMFDIVNDQIVKIGDCKFGEACRYAHRKEEISQNVETCKLLEKCRSIKVTVETVMTNNEERKVRRYKNVNEKHKCCRLHPKERIIDFIKRVKI
jgi:hypothetical protein